MSIVLRSRKTLAQRYRGVLKKYSTSHLWDFGVPQSALTYAATHTAAEFLSAYPLWHLYQDAAGSVPACKINDPVGLCLDQGGGSVTLGNNLIVGSDLTTPSGWTADGSDGTHSATFSAVGCRYQSGTTSPRLSVAQTTPIALISGRVYRLEFEISNYVSGAIKSDAFSSGAAFPTGNGKYSYLAICSISSNFAFTRSTTNVDLTISNLYVREVIGAHASQATTTKRPILSCRVNLLTATTTLSTQSITTLAASYKLTFTGSGTVTLSGTYSGSLVSGGSLTFTATAGTLTLTVTGSVTLADLRPANSPTNIPAYQRVTSATDYYTVGFPVRAVFDGVDDCLVVPLLDLSPTDKVTVVAGVTKLSDAARGMCIELGDGSLDTVGNIQLNIPNESGGNVSVIAQGTSGATETVATLAPSPLVVSFTSSISADSLKLKVNSGISVTSAQDQGAGNYSSKPFCIGQRAGTSLPFNGAIQSLAVIGNLLPDGEVKLLEDVTNAAMGKVY